MGGSDYDLESLVEDEEEDKANLDYSVVLQLSMLLLAFIFAYVLKRSNFHYLHEAGAAMILGAFVGCTVKFAGGTKHSFKENMDFHEEIFFLVLLPPIIFESGYNMTQVKAFFRNFGGICVFAFLGTAISTVIIGNIVYFAGYCGLIYEMNLINSLIFGALISATDPVTVLAIFQELRVDVDLYSLVFGESVLNDAVAIVLFKTLTTFTNTPVTTHGVIAAFLQFGLIFVGSLVIGTAVALLAAMLFKGLHLKGEEEFHVIETCLVVLLPYVAYTAAECLRLSGIVSILFCGIVMRHYMVHNLSEWSQSSTKLFFKTLATLAETFVFIYMGVAALLEPEDWATAGFAMVAFVACLLARAANVFPCAFLVGRFRRAERAISGKKQFMLWVSGLRGAIAFALAAESGLFIGEADGKVVLTATVIIVATTVIVIGGSTTTLIERLDLREKEEEEIPDFVVHRSANGKSDNQGDVASPWRAAEIEGHQTPRNRAWRKVSNTITTIHMLSANVSFGEVDRKWLRPLFLRRDALPDDGGIELSSMSGDVTAAGAFDLEVEEGGENAPEPPQSLVQEAEDSDLLLSSAMPSDEVVVDAQ